MVTEQPTNEPQSPARASSPPPPSIHHTNREPEPAKPLRDPRSGATYEGYTGAPGEVDDAAADNGHET
ncbi:MAG: hypothetical protein KDE27_21915 [Planctomycetes bacterium]|nr:hypothetical protein [Planctomycetota bacterium]